MHSPSRQRRHQDDCYKLENKNLRNNAFYTLQSFLLLVFNPHWVPLRISLIFLRTMKFSVLVLPQCNQEYPGMCQCEKVLYQPRGLPFLVELGESAGVICWTWPLRPSDLSVVVNCGRSVYSTLCSVFFTWGKLVESLIVQMFTFALFFGDKKTRPPRLSATTISIHS